MLWTLLASAAAEELAMALPTLASGIRLARSDSLRLVPTTVEDRGHVDLAARSHPARSPEPAAPRPPRHQFYAGPLLRYQGRARIIPARPPLQAPLALPVNQPNLY